ADIGLSEGEDTAAGHRAGRIGIGDRGLKVLPDQPADQRPAATGHRAGGIDIADPVALHGYPDETADIGEIATGDCAARHAVADRALILADQAAYTVTDTTAAGGGIGDRAGGIGVADRTAFVEADQTAEIDVGPGARHRAADQTDIADRPSKI